MHERFLVQKICSLKEVVKLNILVYFWCRWLLDQTVPVNR